MDEWAGFSVPAVSRRASVSVPLLYRPFEHEEGLLLAAQAHSLRTTESLVADRLGSSDPAGLEEAVQAAVSAFAEVFAVHGAFLRALRDRAFVDARVREVGAASLREARDAFARHVLTTREWVTHPDPAMATNVCFRVVSAASDQEAQLGGAVTAQLNWDSVVAQLWIAASPTSTPRRGSAAPNRARCGAGPSRSHGRGDALDRLTWLAVRATRREWLRRAGGSPSSARQPMHRWGSSTRATVKPTSTSCAPTAPAQRQLTRSEWWDSAPNLGTNPALSGSHAGGRHQRARNGRESLPATGIPRGLRADDEADEVVNALTGAPTECAHIVVLRTFRRRSKYAPWWRTASVVDALSSRKDPLRRERQAELRHSINPSLRPLSRALLLHLPRCDSELVGSRALARRRRAYASDATSPARWHACVSSEASVAAAQPRARCFTNEASYAG